MIAAVYLPIWVVPAALGAAVWAWLLWGDWKTHKAGVGRGASTSSRGRTATTPTADADPKPYDWDRAA